MAHSAVIPSCNVTGWRDTGHSKRNFIALTDVDIGRTRYDSRTAPGYIAQPCSRYAVNKDRSGADGDGRCAMKQRAWRDTNAHHRGWNAINVDITRPGT